MLFMQQYNQALGTERSWMYVTSPCQPPHLTPHHIIPLKSLTVPYILESNPHPFCSFRRLKIRCGLESRADYIRGRELDFGKMIEPLYVWGYNSVSLIECKKHLNGRNAYQLWYVSTAGSYVNGRFTHGALVG
jgi:hypothetical protein